MIDSLITTGCVATVAFPHIEKGQCWSLHWHSLSEGMLVGTQQAAPYILIGCARLQERATLQSQLGLGECNDDLTLLFAAWQRWGRTAPQYLYGEWLLLAWNPHTGAGWLARDAHANTPWFYHCDAAGLRIATRIPTLLAAGVAHQLDEEGLATWVMSAHQAGITPYKEIYTLPIGHALTWHEGQAQTERWWHPEITPKLHLADEAAYHAAFRELYVRILADLLPDTASVMLSSGYDSNSIAAFAAPELARRGQVLQALSLQHSYPVQDYGRRVGDEVTRAQASAQHIGQIEFHPCKSEGTTLAAMIAAQVKLHGLPYGHANSLWIGAMACQAKAAGAGLLLHGQRGNMTVSWYGKGCFWRPLLQGDWRQVLGVMGTRPVHWRRFAREQLARHLWRPLRKYIPRRNAVDFVGHRNHIVPDAWRAELERRPALIDGRKALLGKIRDAEAWRGKLIYESIGSGMYEHGLAAQIACADPTADRRMVEFCYAVPDWVFWAQGEGRGLIRRGLKGILSADILDDRLRGLQSSDLCARIAAEKDEILACLAFFSHQPLLQKWLNIPMLEHLVNRMAAGQSDWPLFARGATQIARGLAIGFFLEQFSDTPAHA